MFSVFHRFRQAKLLIIPFPRSKTVKQTVHKHNCIVKVVSRGHDGQLGCRSWWV